MKEGEWREWEDRLKRRIQVKNISYVRALQTHNMGEMVFSSVSFNFILPLDCSFSNTVW